MECWFYSRRNFRYHFIQRAFVWYDISKSMVNPLSNPAGNVAPRWVYQAILVEMTASYNGQSNRLYPCRTKNVYVDMVSVENISVCTGMDELLVLSNGLFLCFIVRGSIVGNNQFWNCIKNFTRQYYVTSSTTSYLKRQMLLSMDIGKKRSVLWRPCNTLVRAAFCGWRHSRSHLRSDGE